MNELETYKNLATKYCDEVDVWKRRYEKILAINKSLRGEKLALVGQKEHLELRIEAFKKRNNCLSSTLSQLEKGKIGGRKYEKLASTGS